MKKHIMLVLITVLLFVVGFCGCLNAVSKDFNGEYEVDENTILEILNINGEINIENWDGDKVILKAVTKSNRGNDELNKIKIEVVEINNILNIETKYLGTGSVKASTNMDVKVPNFLIIDTVSSSNGNVEINGAKGNATIHSSNGDIKIEDFDGYVKVSSSNGDLEIRDTTGIDDLATSNGKIDVEIFDFKENITITSSNGEITVDINPSLNADVYISTSNGEIFVSGISLNITAKEEKYLSEILGLGGNRIEINSSNGNIYFKKLNI